MKGNCSPMKSSTPVLASLGLAAAALILGACAPDTARNEPSSRLALLSNGPDLPEECKPCWDSFQECFADGSDLQVCGDAIVECANECQAPPPPDECLHCAAGFEACALAVDGTDATAEDCAAGFEGCLSACQSDDPGDPGDPTDPTDPTEPEPPLDAEHCEIAADECFNDLWSQTDEAAEDAAQICEQLLDECFADCPNLGEPGDHGEPNEPGADCEEAVNLCLDGAQDANDLNCDEILDFCLGNPDDHPTEPDSPDWP